MKQKKHDTKDSKEGIERRLDAIIRLTIESRYSQEKGFNESIAARTLKSSGLTPTEIARILGKKSATDVAPYLYGKSQKKREQRPKEVKEEGSSVSTHRREKTK